MTVNPRRLHKSKDEVVDYSKFSDHELQHMLDSMDRNGPPMGARLAAHDRIQAEMRSRSEGHASGVIFGRDGALAHHPA